MNPTPEQWPTNPSCCCVRYYDPRKRGASQYKGIAVTFICPVHGQITFDQREIPPPTPGHAPSKQEGK